MKPCGLEGISAVSRTEWRISFMGVCVLQEKEKDYRQVEEVTRFAFSYPERIERGRIGCPYEHWMVHELRKRDGILALSLTAWICGNLVGHLICSRAVVQLAERELPVLNLGPVSVLPDRQRQGIGKALIINMVDRARQLGYGAILFFGRPEYYPQFGFREASEYGIADCHGEIYPAFMGMELVEGYLEKVRGGRFYESDIYDDEKNREAVKAFDREFMAHKG